MEKCIIIICNNVVYIAKPRRAYIIKPQPNYNTKVLYTPLQISLSSIGLCFKRGLWTALDSLQQGDTLFSILFWCSLPESWDPEEAVRNRHCRLGFVSAQAFLLSIRWGQGPWTPVRALAAVIHTQSIQLLKDLGLMTCWSSDHCFTQFSGSWSRRGFLTSSEW